ncbi:hypothetical protein BU23DRAFT_604782, partial [Bimuria novae-zelandiae CBS 107.79]
MFHNPGYRPADWSKSQADWWGPSALVPSNKFTLLDIKDASLQQVSQEIEEFDAVALEEEESIPEPILLTTAQFGSLITTDLEFALELPEYPTTHKNGYTYCVNTTKVTDIKHALVQYSWSQIHSPTTATSPFLNQARGKKWKMRCSRVLCCEYLYNTLRALSHLTVTKQTWALIQDLRESINSSNPDPIRRDTNAFVTCSIHIIKILTIEYSLFRSLQRRFQQGIACVSQHATCQLELRSTK